MTLEDVISLGIRYPVNGGSFEINGKCAAWNEIPDGTPPSNIWTIVEYDDDVFLAQGVRFVNREGFIITDHPYTGELDIEVEV